LDFFKIISSFSYRKEIDFNKLLEFSKQYTPFVEVSLLVDKEEKLNKLVLKYRRTNNSSDLPVIFEFIEKERLEGIPAEKIVESIMRRFGRNREEASEVYKNYRIMKEDPQTARRFIKESGVNIIFSKSEDFIEIRKKQKFYRYKIFIHGLPSLFILNNCYQFLQHFVSSFYHPTLAPEKKASQILVNKGIEFDFGYQQENVAPKDLADIEEREPVSENDDLILSGLTNLDININNLNVNQFNLDNNGNQKGKITKENVEKMKEEMEEEKGKKQKKGEFSSTGDINILDESSTDPTVRLRCPNEENKIREKGTCKNICDDLRFKLRRLQQFEPRIFHFPHLHGKNKPYSRQCDDMRRPIVMAYDPKTNPKIDKTAFTYSIKYRSSEKKPYYYYICPQAWCPICEIPIPVSKIKNRKTVRTKKGDCEFGICPHGDHQVYINAKGQDYIYPGFIDPGGNPEGLCMPCCFKIFSKNSYTYKRCREEENLSEADGSPDGESEHDEEGWP
jgi:hypothetical protein